MRELNPLSRVVRVSLLLPLYVIPIHCYTTSTCFGPSCQWLICMMVYLMSRQSLFQLWHATTNLLRMAQDHVWQGLIDVLLKRTPLVS